jgi:hypothetical protein
MLRMERSYERRSSIYNQQLVTRDIRHLRPEVFAFVEVPYRV